MKQSRSLPRQRHIPPIQAEKNLETNPVNSTIQNRYLAGIVRLAEKLFFADKKDVRPAPEIQYRPSVMVIVVNPRAAFFEARDPEIVKMEIARGKERTQEKCAEPKKRSKFKER